MITPLSLSEKDVYQKGSHYKLHHLIFWVLYFLFWVFLFRPGDTVTMIVLNSILIIVIHAIASYINLYILFPKLLKQRYYLYYIAAFLMTISLANTLHGLIIYGFNQFGSAQHPRIWTVEFYITNGMAIAYTVAITMSLKLVKQWYERDKQNKELQKLNTETELKFLKSQINPHFLFNTLNSLYALSLQKSDRTPELVLKLSDILRYVLYDSTEHMVPLDKEINYLKSYLDLEQIRYGDRVDIQLDIDGEVRGKEIAPLLFIPFVENSFKHGFGNNTLPGYLKIKISSDQEEIRVVISNSVNGKKASDSEEYSGGIGLANVRKRLKLLYPNTHRIELTETENSFEVTLLLKLQELKSIAS